MQAFAIMHILTSAMAAIGMSTRFFTKIPTKICTGIALAAVVAAALCSMLAFAIYAGTFGSWIFCGKSVCELFNPMASPSVTVSCGYNYSFALMIVAFVASLVACIPSALLLREGAGDDSKYTAV